MDHLQAFKPRPISAFPVARQNGWLLKRYAILAEGRESDDGVMTAALSEACARLPASGALADPTGNHGVGVQIVHFAQVAVVSPVFYWQWGSVLARLPQMRAQWQTPSVFEDGVPDVVGCVWEMEIVAFEVAAWQRTMLSGVGCPAERLDAYLGTFVA